MFTIQILILGPYSFFFPLSFHIFLCNLSGLLILNVLLDLMNFFRMSFFQILAKKFKLLIFFSRCAITLQIAVFFFSKVESFQGFMCYFKHLKESSYLLMMCASK
jgi:hypothetical protein